MLAAFTSCNSDQAPKNKITANAADSTLFYGKEHPLYRLDSLIRDKGAVPQYLFERAKLRMHYGDPTGALEDMKRLRAIDSSKSEYLLTVADIYLKLAQKNACDDAGKILAQVAKTDSLNPNYLVKLAKKTFICKPGFKNHLEAFGYINQALRINAQLPEAYFWKGMIYIEENNPKLAISSFQTATEVDPYNYEAFVQLGQLHNDFFKDTLRDESAKRTAISYYSNAIAIDSFNDEALYARGMLYKALNDTARAIADFQRIVKVYPRQVDALYNLGILSYMQGNLDDAITRFSNVIKLDSTYAIAYYARAVCHEDKKEVLDAVKDYREVLKFVPNEPDAKLGLERLKNQ